MTSKVDTYLLEGCGRCAFYQTAQCKVHTWTEELIQLRRIVLESGLKEEYKWSQPCYTQDGGNVLIVTAFKEFASLAFFKGVLLKDTKHILVAPGENSQASRQLRFTSTQAILAMEATIKTYIAAAIAIEKAGTKVPFKKQPEAIPEELKSFLDENPAVKKAFQSLTPVRQRGYILHFSQPKQSATRISRIEKNIQKILDGKGFHDR